MASSEAAEESPLLALLTQQLIPGDAVLKILQHAYDQRSDDLGTWLGPLKYVRFVRELRKRLEVGCLGPTLFWAVKENNTGIPQLTLLQALKLSDVELLKTVAQYGYDMNKYRDDAGLPLIHLAVLKKDLRLVKALYDLSCDFNQTDRTGKHALTCDSGRYVFLKAVADKKADIAFILKMLQCGIDVNCEDDKGQTALLKACQGGNENKRLVKTLLERGANLHHQDHDGNTAIILACHRNYYEVVEVLLAAGANVHDRNKRGTTPILKAAALSKDRFILKTLLQEGANINDCDNNGMTPLIIALKHRHLSTVEMLTKAGASCHISHDKLLQALRKSTEFFINFVYKTLTDADIKQEFGRQFFTIALQKGALKIALFLLHRGADPNVTLDNGKTPFEVALEARHPRLAVELLRKGAKVELQESSLRKIAKLGLPELLQEVLRLGTNPNEQDSFGNTVIHEVVKNNIVQVLECLCSAGADLNVRNNEGDVPLHLASDTAMSKALLSHGAQVNVSNNQAQTPLLKILEVMFDRSRPFLESNQKKRNFVTLFLEHGADILKADNKGNSPLSVCLQDTSGECLDAMLQHSSVPNDILNQLLVPALDKKSFRCIDILLKHGADPTLISNKESLCTDMGGALMCKESVERKKEDVKLTDFPGISPLMLACKQNSVDRIEALLADGATVNETDNSGATALFYCESTACARLLLQAGADPNHRNNNGSYPHSTCTDIDWLEALLAAGADVNKANSFGITPLINAVTKENKNVINFLLANHIRKADPNIVNYLGQTALSVACRKNWLSVISLLLEHGADGNIGAAPLIVAFNHDNVDTIPILLNHGCNPNQTNSFGETLLLLAARCGSRDKRQRVLEMLEKTDVDVNVGDEHGRTLLHLTAAQETYMSLLPFLLKRHAQFTRFDAFGRTVLHHWRPRRDTLVQLAFCELLKDNVDVNQQDYNGHTPMHLAVLEPDVQIRQTKCRELLKYGADLSICDKNGLTVYHLATCDPQLFHSLLKQMPYGFNDDSLAMIYTLSKYFETVEIIRKVLSDIDSPLVSVTTESKVNVSFGEAHNLAEWSKDMIERMATLGHHKFFENILHTEILCSYPPPKMAEIQEKARMVLSLFSDIAREVGKYDKMLEFTPFISGSSNEGTKVIQPDEMDMLCVLHNFNDLEFTDCFECPSLLSMRQYGEDSYHQFLMQDDSYLLQTKVFSHFYYAFGKALQSQELWQKYPKLYRIRTDDMSHSNQSITDLSLVCHGEHFPFLEFSVDVVPAFNAGKWLPKQAREHPLLHRNGILAIPKFRIEHIKKTDITKLFQASFERSEADLFHMMPVELKQAYMLAKIIKSKIPRIEHLPVGMFISSYLMKTCTFWIFKDQPEYEERLKRFLECDKKSAALTQEPYDPHPLAPAADIMYWCKQIFTRLEQAMTARYLPAFFMPEYNLVGHKVYGENYRPQLMAQICRTMLVDPSADPAAWQQLALAQPWRIADVGETLTIDTSDTCKCSSYFCIKKHSRSVCK